MPRKKTDSTLAELFRSRYAFQLDDFQLAAIAELESGRSVLVAAPTGTGKTLVAEFAIYRAFAQGKRVFYTTPIKALSNQKYRDFNAQYPGATGLLTGDVVIEPTASARVDDETGAVEIAPTGGGQVVVMTTEVLRNMLLQADEDEIERQMRDVACVVFDEIHYMADPQRGTTWEEAIICAPEEVQFVCLSATVANAQEITDWISDVHAPTTLIYYDKRAVPLEHYYFFEDTLHLAVDALGNRIARLKGIGGEKRKSIRGRGTEERIDRRSGGRGGRDNGRDEPRHGAGRRRQDSESDLPRNHAPYREPWPDEIVLNLRRSSLLPAIYFLFSRRDTELAGEACARLRLATPDARQKIVQVVEARLSHLEASDRELNQVKLLLRLLPQGVGFHHAGMLPVLKVLVEELFNAGLLGVVFATDTLSLGINMPARTVVIGGFLKFDGESKRLLTTNEYRQLTGRAGRRGIDKNGTAIVPYSSWVSAEEFVDTATGPIQPVESAFLIRYNTVLNLWPEPGQAVADLSQEAEDSEGNDATPAPDERLVRLLSSSLREYQLDTQLRDLRSEANRLEVLRQSDNVLDCGTCTLESLAEYEQSRKAAPKAQKELERAERDESELLARLEERPWGPSKSEARRLLRIFLGGEPLHSIDHGWGLFVSRPTHDGGVALALFGGSVRLVKTYSELDYLPGMLRQVPNGKLHDESGEVIPRVKLPETLLGVSTEVSDARRLLTESSTDEAAEAMLGEIDERLVALGLPDLEALAAQRREERRQAIAPRLLEAAKRVAAAREKKRELDAQLAENPSRLCPDRGDHHRKLRDLESAQERIDEIRGQIGYLSNLRRKRTRQTLRAIQKVLLRFDYLEPIPAVDGHSAIDPARLDEPNRRGQRTRLQRRSRAEEGGPLRVTPKGQALRDVFDPNGLIILEALDRALLSDLPAPELAEVFSWFAYDRDNTFPNRYGLPEHLIDLREALEGIESEVLMAESEVGLSLSTGFGRAFYGMALSWARGSTFEEVLSRVNMAEGDVMMTFNKTLDLMRQLREMLRNHAPTHPLRSKLREAERLMRRGIVEQCYRIVEATEENEEAAGEIPVKP